MVHVLAERIGDAPDIEAPMHGAQSLQDRLQSAYAAPSFADAATRQAQILENLGERLDRLEQGPDAAGVRGALHDLGMAIAGLALQATRTASETENRIESVADTLALVSGHMASQRADMQRDHMAVANLASSVATLSEELKRLQAVVQASRNETSQNIAALQEQCQQLNGRVTFVEERVAVYHSVEENVEILNRRLEVVEQTSTRREKIMARLHARAARVLQSELTEARLPAIASPTPEPPSVAPSEPAVPMQAPEA